MAKKYWTGDTPAVAQVASGSIDSVDGTPANNDFTVTVGDVAVTVTGDTDVATTAAALVAALEASTHPYIAAVTWTNPSGGTITGTADVAGVPFVATLSVSGAGTGSVTDFSDDTACTGPQFFDEADNWSDNAAPGNGDTVIFADSAVSCLWNLDASSVISLTLIIRKSFTGKIGLRRDAFATSADGETVDTSVAEYRDTYLKSQYNEVRVGEHYGAGAPSGSGRIKLQDVASSGGTVTIYDTASSASEAGQQAVRLLANSSSSTIIVRGGFGGVGIATDAPGETSTVGSVTVTDQSTGARVQTGEGVTITTFRQSGGINTLQAAATVTTVTVDGGELRTEGAFAITTLNVNGGTCFANNVPSSGSALVTANVAGATLEMRTAGQAQTIGTLNLTEGGTLAASSLVDVDTAATLDGQVTGEVSFA